MPKDPVISINDQRRAYTEQENALRIEAAERIGSDPQASAALMKLTPDQRDEEINRQAQRLKELQPDNFPVRDPSSPPPLPLVNGPGRMRQGVSTVLDSMPNGSRPDSSFDAIGLGSLESLSKGELPRLDDAGNILQIGSAAGGALLPQGRITRLGIPAGKAALQTIGGASAGAAAAGMAQQVLENAQDLLDKGRAILNETMGTKAAPPMDRWEAIQQAWEATPVEAMMFRGMSEALLESGTAGAAHLVPGAKIAFAEYAGITTEKAKQFIRLAGQHKVSIGLHDAAESRIVSRAGNMIGQFPATFTKFAEGRARQAAETGRAIANSVGDIGPIVTTLSKLTGDARAERLMKVGVDSFNKFTSIFPRAMSEANARYEAFRSAARADGSTVGNINTAMYAMIERRKLRNLGSTEKTRMGPDGKPITYKEEIEPEGDMAIADRLLTRLIEMETNPTLEQFINNGNAIEAAIQNLEKGSPAAGILVRMKQRMEIDIKENLNGSSDVRALRDKADSFYEQMFAVLGGQAGRRVKKIDKTFGKVTTQDVTEEMLKSGDGLREAGVASPENFISVMLDSKDRSTVANLHSILTRYDKQEGQEIFNDVVGTWVDTQVKAATDNSKKIGGVGITNIKQLRKNLGLDNENSAKYLATREMFKKAGTNLDKFDGALTLASRFFDETLPDVSTFIARRALLGGFSSAARSFNPVAGKLKAQAGQGQAFNLVQNVAATAATLIAMRKSAAALVDPKVLDNYLILLDPKRNLSHRISAIRRLMAIDATFLVFDDNIQDAFDQTQHKISSSASDMMNWARESQRNRQSADGRVIDNLPPLQER